MRIRRQGIYLLPQEVERIKFLLGSTDLAIQDIAVRMDCAKTTIVKLNRKFRIREYRGRRSFWNLPAGGVTQGQIRYDEETRIPLGNYAGS
jgi:hypothetical protein